MKWPPGFRFHPTDEELVLYYLKRKICRRRLKADVIGEVDVYKWDPEELPGQAILKSGDRQWFFFTPRDRKYPNAARSGRGTATGYWKATGKDRTIMYNSRAVGLKKTLVFYRGRAPNGQRTDWVMHEFTVDEEELKRCQNPKDYYALYKVYKKSGAGPKNGEQYGAPFREEDWVDDDHQDDAINATNSEVRTSQHNVVTSVDNGIANNRVDFPSDDIEKFFSAIAEKPALPPTQGNRCAEVVPQEVDEEERERALVLPTSQPYNECTNIDLSQSVSSKRQLNESFEVSSAPKISDTPPLVLEKGDYIEVDDLLTLELTSFAEKPTQNLNLDEFDGFNEFDLLFHDVAMSFDNIEPVVQETVPHQTLDAFGSDMANWFDHQVQPYADLCFQQQTEEFQLNYASDPTAVTNADQFSTGLWTELQRTEVFASTPPQSNIETQPRPTSGVMYEPTSPLAGVSSQDPGRCQEAGGKAGQFSSDVWAFVESIPAKPASAAEEGPLVNRVLVRWSSFGRVRFDAKNTTNATCISSNATVTAKRCSRSMGFVFLPIIGVLCALLWAFVSAV